MGFAPIVLFVYNRPWHTKQTIEALKKNYLAKESDLYIFSDATKSAQNLSKVEQVRGFIHSVSGFKSIKIVERQRNMGLAASIIDGVSIILKKHGKVIVLEDDLLVSPYFLNFMNEGLDFYKMNDGIFSLSGFSFSREFMKFKKNYDDVYFHYRPMSWSWATWADRWVSVDWSISDYIDFIKNNKELKKFERGGKDLPYMLSAQMKGELDSWYIRWSYNCYKKDMLNVYPSCSLVNNIGHDGTGVHCNNEEGNSVFSHLESDTKSKWSFVEKTKVSSKVIERFNRAFYPSFFMRLKRKVVMAVQAILRR